MGSNNDISLKALAKINLGLDVVRRAERTGIMRSV